MPINLVVALGRNLPGLVSAMDDNVQGEGTWVADKLGMEGKRRKVDDSI